MVVNPDATTAPDEFSDLALVLSGGGARASYQVGVLRAVAERVPELRFPIVTGYRANRQDAPHRRLNAWAWGTLVKLLLGFRVRDVDCAFKVFRREVLDGITIESQGAMINTEILAQTTRKGYQIKEIPVTHLPRTAGEQSGANPKVKTG